MKLHVVVILSEINTLLGCIRDVKAFLPLLQKLEELEKEEELRETAGLYDSEPVSDIV